MSRVNVPGTNVDASCQRHVTSTPRRRDDSDVVGLKYGLLASKGQKQRLCVHGKIMLFCQPSDHGIAVPLNSLPCTLFSLIMKIYRCLSKIHKIFRQIKMLKQNQYLSHKPINQSINSTNQSINQSIKKHLSQNP